MYVLANINAGGFIYVRNTCYSKGYWDGEKCLHKESRKVDSWVSSSECFTNITKGKEAFLDYNTGGNSIPLLVHLDSSGGADLIWVAPRDRVEVNQRLKIWSGCYGAWPVKELNV